MVSAKATAAKGLRRLKAAGVDNAVFENAQLAKKRFGATPYDFAAKDSGVSAPAAVAYYRDILRRVNGEPLQYILGEWEFMSLPFRVTPDVLIPRPDTETLVEAAVSELRKLPSPVILDLCTGSGCIAVSVLRYAGHASGYACDISGPALQIARENAEKSQVSGRLSFLQWDVLSGEPFPIRDEVSLILCNPPYIPRNEIDSLDIEVCRHEPRIALDGGDDGLLFYRKIAGNYKSLLMQGGTLLFEHGLGQSGDVCAILRENGYADIRVYHDLAGIERCASGRKLL